MKETQSNHRQQMTPEEVYQEVVTLVNMMHQDYSRLPNELHLSLTNFTKLLIASMDERRTPHSRQKMKNLLNTDPKTLLYKGMRIVITDSEHIKVVSDPPTTEFVDNKQLEQMANEALEEYHREMTSVYPQWALELLSLIKEHRVALAHNAYLEALINKGRESNEKSKHSKMANT